MSITREHPSLRLSVLPQTFFVRQTTEVPNDALARLCADPRAFLSITRTADEWSLVGECADGDLDGKWMCIKVAGPMDFGLTGIMCDLSTPLKRAGVPIFAISTWNTDYVLVPKEKVGDAVLALRGDGWLFDSSVPEMSSSQGPG
ncbi:ACT domain-containing protein [Epithele typhae]|uniref:ACT domain-containing protein n=1 Tax=Epithele typhae TaxID=378194 RepID=UPI002007CC16|nr:ACT domain-containing protein [Epithele typhae]KAH9925864.1 ACT domain-containing protein [Epithele typhae]